MSAQYNKKNKSGLKDNRGAALITVVIVLMFISILCTLVLYISAVNYRMKKADYLSKVSFYSSEKPLEHMQSGLVEPVSISYNYAMQITNARYDSYASVDDRKLGFYQTFRDQFVKTLHSRYSTEDIKSVDFVEDMMSTLTGIPESRIYTCADGSYWSSNADLFIDALVDNNLLTGLDGTDVSYMVLPTYDSDLDGDYVNNFITLELIDPNTGLAYDDDHIRVVFHDIYIVTIENNSTSIVRSDIAVQMPPIDWVGGTGNTGRVEFNANEMLFYVNWQKR